MCGRFTMTASNQRSVANRFDFNLDDAIDQALERYNVAPTQEVVAVRERHPEEKKELPPEVAETRDVRLQRWGLVPVWADDLKVSYKMINAKAENLLSSRAYSPLVKKPWHRCLIIADGFYEWIRAENPKEPRIPMRFTVDGGEPFAFAGLTTRKMWEGEFLYSCTIITTTANEVVSPVHDRMPVILPHRETEAAWIGGEVTPEEAVSLCRPLDASRMEAKPANPILNKVGGAKEGPEFLTAASPQSRVASTGD